MMVGGNRGEMQSAKTSSPSLFVSVSLATSHTHTYTHTHTHARTRTHEADAASSSLSKFELIQSIGNKGLQESRREMKVRTGGRRWKRESER